MAVRELTSDVYNVGAIDWDRTLFDELIPLPEGTSYNAYLIKSDKTALIDTVDPPKQNELFRNLQTLDVDRIDYVICNHAEQDHSGTIPKVLELHPEAKVVTNAKCKGILQDHMEIADDRFLIVDDGDTLALGGRTLEFIIAPWVHWPETMLTFLREDGILFPCDLFGSHLATSDTFMRDECYVHSTAKRYYAEIMMPFRNLVKRYVAKVKSLAPRMIAPSHGPAYDKPEMILDAYEEWVADDVKNEVVLPFVSMHDSTRKMVDHLIESLIREGVTVKPFNLTTSDLGEIAMAMVDAATIVIATPTVLVGPHPSAVYAAYLVNALRPKTKFVSVMCSYGWGSKAVDTIKGMLGNLRAEFLEPVIAKGVPKDEDYREIDRLAAEIRRRHEDL